MTRDVEIDLVPVRLPQLGANDSTAQILEWLVPEGTYVRIGEPICSVETTKSVSDVEAQAAGYLVPLIEPGSDVETGKVIAVLAAQPVSKESAQVWLAESAEQDKQRESEAASASRRGNNVQVGGWTYKAALLARQHGLEIATLPTPLNGGKLAEADVRMYLKMQDAQSVAMRPATDTATPIAARDLMNDPYPHGRQQRLLIIGGGAGAIQVIDAVAKAPRQLVVAVMDDNPSLHGSTINGVPIIGNVEIERAVEMLQGGAFDAAVISVSSSIPFRARIFDDWSARGIPFANVIHPSAVVGSNVAWGHGNVVLAFCHIGACATIGNDNFLSAYCSIEHHSVLHDHCSFGPGVVTSMGVQIADRVRFGTGIFIEPNLNIGTESVIGSGCTLWQHVSPRTVLKSRLNYVERPLRTVLAPGHERARVDHEQGQPVARPS